MRTMEDLPEGEVPEEGASQCNFDRSNKKSPCNYAKCSDDESDPSCIRYILDYCLAYNDRGCVIQLPQLLNKLTSDEYNNVKTIKSDFVS